MQNASQTCMQIKKHLGLRSRFDLKRIHKSNYCPLRPVRDIDVIGSTLCFKAQRSDASKWSPMFSHSSATRNEARTEDEKSKRDDMKEHVKSSIKDTIVDVINKPSRSLTPERMAKVKKLEKVQVEKYGFFG